MRAKPKPWAGDGFKARVEKFSRWLLYGVVIGLLPFAFPFIKGAVVGPHMTLTLLFGRGDLFLVTATLVAASFGDLIAGGKERALGKIWVGFLCFVLFVLCIIWFGTVSDALDIRQRYDAAATATVSMIVFVCAIFVCAIFVCAIFVCACALLLSEETKTPRDGSKAL